MYSPPPPPQSTVFHNNTEPLAIRPHLQNLGGVQTPLVNGLNQFSLLKKRNICIDTPHLTIYRLNLSL